jgi:hypothetical protein
MPDAKHPRFKRKRDHREKATGACWRSAFMHYNFCRKHSTIKTTPAQAAGIAGHQWTLAEVSEMVEAHFVTKENAKFEADFAAARL